MKLECADLNENKLSYKEMTIKEEQVEKYLRNGRDFIDDEYIEELLKKNKDPDPGQIKDILAKSYSVETLTLEEVSLLINVRDPQIWEMMKETAARIKKKVYDNRIVTFAPLYLGNRCVNNCLYCGFRRDNHSLQRHVLSLDDVRKETRVLAGEIGHKRLIVVYGEHPSTDVDYMVSTIETIYAVEEKTRHGKGKIRRVNVNAAPMDIEKLSRLRAAGIGTYQVFQETYHHKTYEKMHPAGDIKAHYGWRLYSMHRAMEAGVDDVGLGALFGLYDWKFEVMGLAAHSRELESVFGIGPHTISFPRIEPALGTDHTQGSPYRVSDDDFKKLVTVIRLAVPHTGMIITARESAALRDEVISLGCTQTDASTRIGVGSYSNAGFLQREEGQQFLLGDTRSLEELIRKFCEMGYITSFCTAGYRCGRTGECIMDMLKSGKEGAFCKLNAVITFREWLDDFAGEETKKIAEPLILREMSEVKEKLPEFYPTLMEYYEKTRRGQRDLYF